MRATLCLSLSLCLFALPAFAQDEEMMMPPYAQPGPEHEQLQKMIGTWNVASTYWMEPGEEPIVSEGRARITSMFEGRFIRQEFSDLGSFEGFSIDGFDRLNGKFVSVWVDNFGTAMYTLEGTEENGVTTMYGDWPNPEGGLMRVKSTSSWNEDGSLKVEMFNQVAGGEWSQMMELVYTRAAE